MILSCQNITKSFGSDDILKDISCSQNYKYFTNSHEVTLIAGMPTGTMRYLLRGEPMAYKNNGEDTENNLKKVVGIARESATKEDFGSLVYEKAGVDLIATSENEIIYN